MRGAQVLHLRMLKRLLHWAIFVSLILHLFSCVVLGQDHMPQLPF